MLIIVESPAKAKTISRIVGKNYVVKASVGHIRQISNVKKTEDGRSLEINGIDIDKEFKPMFEVDEDKKKVVSELKKLAKSAKDGILFATDEDREGEAISWHLAEVLKVDPTKVKRLVFHEITEKAIKKALQSPRNLDLHLVSAQQARQVLDKLVGYKLSPVLWSTMSNRHLSAGRVQSPALRLVVDREKEIEAFVPVEYWDFYGKFNFTQNPLQFKTLLSDNQERTEFKKEIENEGYLKLTQVGGQTLKSDEIDNQKALKIQESVVKDLQFIVGPVQTKEETARTKPPFTTSTLQQAASSKLGFSPKQTMRLAQKLYEGVPINGSPTALITYMRTDSFNLSQDSVAAARQYLTKNYPNYLPEKPKFYKSKSKNAQEAHEAIRPVDPLKTPQSLKTDLEPAMWRLYDLIWKQMLACQMTDQKRRRFSFELENSQKDKFKGSVAFTTHAGFKAIWSDQAVAEEKLSATQEIPYKQGEKLFLNKFVSLQSFTTPPARYSAASLIKKLEELGIGRPSTYASIISTLHDRMYVESLGQSIHPTTLGVKVSNLLSDNFTEITGSQFTADMEDKLDEISRGEKTYQETLNNFWWEFKKEVESKQSNTQELRSKYSTTETEVEDPKFGDKMVLKVGRFGEYYQNPNHPEVMYPKNFREVEAAEIKFRAMFAEQTKGKKCEDCGKDLIVRVSKSTLNPYIACAEYKVGNKHTVTPVNYGPCPKCTEEKRDGVLLKKSARGRSYFACSLDKKICGHNQPKTPAGWE